MSFEAAELPEWQEMVLSRMKGLLFWGYPWVFRANALVIMTIMGNICGHVSGLAFPSMSP